MVSEIKRAKDLEYKTGIRLPQPFFFYVERYGRKLEENMEEILPMIGKKEWFLFKADYRIKEVEILQKFKIELEKNAKLGKEYSECILIELPEDVLWDKEMNEFLNYLKDLEGKINFFFTTKQGKNTDDIQEYIEQYFFIRKIYAAKYTKQEQMKKIQEICNEYNVEISKEAEDIFLKGLERKQWNEQDQVMLKIKNCIYSEIYELLLNQELPQILMKEMAEDIIKKLQPVTKKIHTIGFC